MTTFSGVQRKKGERLIVAVTAALICAVVLTIPAVAQPTQPRIHQLPATPETVVWGYYSATAEPVLRIASGDMVDVITMITNRPNRLEAAGVPPDQIQQSLRDIVDQVTDRGPGGHILTGPIYVEGAEQGDVLEVRIISIGLEISYGYNGCSGFIPDNCG